jgi:hypothetical protein
MEQLLILEPGSQNGGIYANKPGYHNTRKANLKTNYSVVDLVDKQGPNDKAAAYDWTFPTSQTGNYTRIAHFTNLLLKSAKDMNDPRLNGWREFYGQADMDTAVEGWDTRYGVPATSDPSHLWHIHMSETRGLVGDRANKVAMLSVLKGETTAQWLSSISSPQEEDTMSILIQISDDPRGAGATYVTDWVSRRWLSPDALAKVQASGGPKFDSSVKSYTMVVADVTFGPDIDTLKGQKGDKGDQGDKGDPGTTFMPHTHTTDTGEVSPNVVMS